MKETLLSLVQDVLNDLDGEEVNSITDTEESEQVARHIRSVYKEIVSNSIWPHTRRAVALVPRSDSNFPTHVSVREDLKELISINYDRAKVGEDRRMYKEVKYLEPDQFLVKLNKRDNTSENVDIVIDDSGIELLINNSKAPEYYTSFDDVNIVFDSYDSEVDTTIHQAKLQAMGYIIPEFRIEDEFIPDLPADAFALLREESISRCQFKMRQFQDVKADRSADKQHRWQSRKSWIVAGGITYPDHGRK